jgi:hypothetical protein
LTKHQRENYSRFKFGILNKYNRVETLDNYKKFINTSFIEDTQFFTTLLNYTDNIKIDETNIYYSYFNESTAILN